jgi:cell division protein FtsN
VRFDVPQPWIREVMHVESGGYQYRANGTLTTSPVGAMGLMQLMPATYDEMRARYGLGDDAFEPHNNIMAGTAYLREMYDQFGSPGFLAAYNAGPARLADYLANHRSLPDETRRYVYMIGSRISGVRPQSISPADQLASNQIPVSIPAGPRYGYPRHTVMVASRGHRRHEVTVQYASYTRHAAPRVSPAYTAPVEVAEAPEPRRAAYHVAAATTHASHGLHLISPAMAAENMKFGGRDWSVQIGAYGNSHEAQAAAGAAKARVGHSSTLVAAVHNGHSTVYRARLGGLTHDAALQACHRLSHKGSNCLLVAPASQ